MPVEPVYVAAIRCKVITESGVAPEIRMRRNDGHVCDPKHCCASSNTAPKLPCAGDESKVAQIFVLHDAGARRLKQFESRSDLGHHRRRRQRTGDAGYSRHIEIFGCLRPTFPARRLHEQHPAHTFAMEFEKVGCCAGEVVAVESEWSAVQSFLG